jgi:FkbM family methyltransferase
MASRMSLPSPWSKTMAQTLAARHEINPCVPGLPGATVEAVDTYRKGQIYPVEQERQISIFGNLLRMIGTPGDLYFESHVSDKADQDVMSVLAAAISDGDSVLDIGANIGFVSLVMSMLSPKGSVFAFEPAHVTRVMLEKNVKLNGRHNISISDAALSDSEGSSTLNYSQSNPSGSFVSESAAFENLGDLVRDRIRLSRLDDEYKSLGVASCSLMKIDVEGHEPNFLRGACLHQEVRTTSRHGSQSLLPQRHQSDEPARIHRAYI